MNDITLPRIGEGFLYGKVKVPIHQVRGVTMDKV